MADQTEADILAALSRGEDWALDQLFREHYGFLCRAVYRVINDRVLVEDLVQDVFYDIWRRRDRIRVQQSVRAYLKRAAINRTLNYIRDNKLVVDDETALPYDLSTSEQHGQQLLETAELQSHINAAIATLPERCRMVFGLSRYELMSNKEIATQLDISVKTVENQMTKALRLLREQLAPYLGVLFFAFCTWLSLFCTLADTSTMGGIPYISVYGVV